MTTLPVKLQEYLDDFETITDRAERTEYLIEIANRFHTVRVPSNIATQPYDLANYVAECESDVYVWAVDNADGTLKYYFDVLNPQGLSAMAMCVVLDETCSHIPLAQIASIPTDIVFTLFGKQISMGKGRGLMGVVRKAQGEALQRLKG